MRLGFSLREGGQIMAQASTLHDAFLDELRDIYHAEKQVTRALPKMVKAATDATLAQAFADHLLETEGQLARIEQTFDVLGETVKAKTCEGMKGILEEGNAILQEEFDECTMDASLIAAAQRVEHYEIAAYGSLVAWARSMKHDEAADLLQLNLDEEKAADEKLTALAEGGINQSAAEQAHGELALEADDAAAGPRSKRPTRTSDR
jgi:ferritin-like metal-binding protein YciE